MEYRELGPTGIRVSTISFGAGPISQLLVGDDYRSQRQTVLKALELGVNWVDTAATYGDGESEQNLGRILAEWGRADRVHVATKVRLRPDQLGSVAAAVRDSVLHSLRRLRLERVTLLQIHNSITDQAGAQPTSITPAHVLDPGGVLEEMDRLRRQGLVEHLGLTALGEPSALLQVIATDAFATLQIPYNLLNPSAGRSVAKNFSEANYGNLMSEALRRGTGVLAIRVLAGGALAGQPPSPHTRKTQFFPLDLYERDGRRAGQIDALLPEGMRREEAAVRFALGHPAVSSAIVGFATADQVAEVVGFAAQGPLDEGLLTRLNDSAFPEPFSGT